MHENNSQRILGRFYLANSLSTLGDGIRLAGLPLLAVQAGRGTALDVALVTGAAQAAWLLAPVIGTFVDRWPPRRCMVGADLARACGLLLLAALAAGHPSLPVVLVLALLTGVGQIFFDCAAQCAVPALARQATFSLERVNSRLMAIQTVGTGFLGPPIGGLLWVQWHPLPFIADGVSFLASAALLAGLRGIAQAVQDRVGRRFLADVWDGLRYLAGQRVLRRLTAAVAILGIAQQCAFGTLVLFSAGELRLQPEGYGLLLAAAAIGALAGARTAEWLVARIGVVPGLWASIAVTGVSYALVALVPPPPLVAVLLALTSAAVIVWNIITVSLRQRIIPVSLMGRVTSGYRLAAWGAMPLGSILGGRIAEASGLAAPWAAAGAIMLLAAPLIWRLGPLVTAGQAAQTRQAEGAARDRPDSPAGARADDQGTGAAG